MDLLHKLLFSLISGFSEFVLISGSAHQFLYTTITGCDQADSAFMMAIHLGWLGALLLSCGKRLKELRYERRLATMVRRRRSRHPDPGAVMDMRITNTAAVPMLIGLLFTGFIPQWLTASGWISLFLLFNGAILFLPSLVNSGNKDSRSFTMLDGLLMGLLAVLGILPGVSRLGCMFSVGLLRGADKKYSLDLSLLTLVPVTAGLICLDAYAAILSGADLSGVQFFVYLLAAAASFAGAYLSVRLVRYVCSHTNTVGFAYYSWGLSVFLFLLYLIIP